MIYGDHRKEQDNTIFNTRGLTAAKPGDRCPLQLMVTLQQTPLSLNERTRAPQGWSANRL